MLPREKDFRSRLRGAQVTARVGVWLGLCFWIAFVTGVFSHYAQESTGATWLPTRPVSLYRVTQSVHVLVGTACVPLLLVKLWSVYPRLFARPDVRRLRATTVHLLERVSILALITSAIFELATGLANVTQWYPWSFGFRPSHYAVGWVATGALALHVAVKLPVVRSALGSDVDAAEPRTGSPAAGSAPAISRRNLLRATWIAAGTAVVAAAGSTVPWLSRVSVFAVRTGDGPQGVPINGTAAAAGVRKQIDDPSFRLVVDGPARRVELSRRDLERMRQHEADLPIACVEGWSAVGRWSGVRVRDLLALVGAPPDSRVKVRSLQRGRRRFDLPPQFAADPLTLLALGLDGEPLSEDHGYPCRIIAPGRPGVTQTKWVKRLEVVG
ncbi:MAG: molybdopterin-dependent oxidoreductase [Propionibacteriales bacterium]|nr:molybdopterin-dependent oxidoreductase [Propionibacteriales bacterium]